MRKTFLCMTTAIALGGFVAAAPAFAQTSAGTDTGPRATARGHQTDAQDVVGDATATIQRMKRNPRFAEMMRRAKGVFIVPNLVKGAVIVGGSGGRGVLLVRRGDGWSDPAFFNTGSISLGAQVGGQAGSVVYVLLSEKALDEFTQKNNFSFGASAGLTILSYSEAAQQGVGNADAVVWSSASGAFVGAAVNGADISASPDEDRSFYGRQVTTQEILSGHATSRRAERLRHALPA